MDLLQYWRVFFLGVSFFKKNAWIYNENNNGDLEEIRLYIGEGDEIFNRKLSLKNKRSFTLSCKDVRIRYLTTKWFHIRHKKLVGPVSDIDRMLFISFWSGQADGVVSEGESFASVHIAASINLSSPREGGGDHCVLGSRVPALWVTSKQLLSQVTPFSMS